MRKEDHNSELKAAVRFRWLKTLSLEKEEEVVFTQQNVSFSNRTCNQWLYCIQCFPGALYAQSQSSQS